jgi:hypothetical protein
MTLIFYFVLLTQYRMKYMIIFKYLLSKPIQHIVEKKDSVRMKAWEWEDVGIFQSGKFSLHITMKKILLKYLESSRTSRY